VIAETDDEGKKKQKVEVGSALDEAEVPPYLRCPTIDLQYSQIGRVAVLSVVPTCPSNTRRRPHHPLSRPDDQQRTAEKVASVRKIGKRGSCISSVWIWPCCLCVTL